MQRIAPRTVARMALLRSVGDDSISRLALVEELAKGPVSLIATQQMAERISERAARPQTSKTTEEIGQLADQAEKVPNLEEKVRGLEADKGQLQGELAEKIRELTTLQAAIGLPPRLPDPEGGGEASDAPASPPAPTPAPMPPSTGEEQDVQVARVKALEERVRTLEARESDLSEQLDQASAASKVLQAAFRRPEMSDATWRQNIARVSQELDAVDADDKVIFVVTELAGSEDSDVLDLMTKNEDTPAGRRFSADRDLMFEQADAFVEAFRERMDALGDGKATPAIKHSVTFDLPAFDPAKDSQEAKDAKPEKPAVTRRKARVRTRKKPTSAARAKSKTPKKKS